MKKAKLVLGSTAVLRFVQSLWNRLKSIESIQWMNFCPNKININQAGRPIVSSGGLSDVGYYGYGGQ